MKRIPESVLRLPLGVRAEMAMREAVHRVIAEHRRAGLPLALWRGGKVVLTPAIRVKPPRLSKTDR